MARYVDRPVVSIAQRNRLVGPTLDQPLVGPLVHPSDQRIGQQVTQRYRAAPDHLDFPTGGTQHRLPRNQSRHSPISLSSPSLRGQSARASLAQAFLFTLSLERPEPLPRTAAAHAKSEPSPLPLSLAIGRLPSVLALCRLSRSFSQTILPAQNPPSRAARRRNPRPGKTEPCTLAPFPVEGQPHGSLLLLAAAGWGSSWRARRGATRTGRRGRTRSARRLQRKRARQRATRWQRPRPCEPQWQRSR